MVYSSWSSVLLKALEIPEAVFVVFPALRRQEGSPCWHRRLFHVYKHFTCHLFADTETVMFSTNLTPA
jgi:hypothetical protein